MTARRVPKHGVRRWLDPFRRGARRAIGAPGGKPYDDAIEAIHAEFEAIHDELAETGARLARVSADVASDLADAEVRHGEVSQRLALLDGAINRLVADLPAYRSSAMEALDRVGSHVEQLRRRIATIGANVATATDVSEATAARVKSLESFVETLSGDAANSVQDINEQLVSMQASLREVAETRAELEIFRQRLEALPYMTSERYERVRPDGATDLGFDESMTGGYRLFEDVFRGTEEFIEKRLAVYLEELAGDVIVDLGCGRGEFLAVLRRNGHSGLGVDLDAQMIASCRDKGLEVHHGDALDWLEARPDSSVGTIFSAQFIEHLDSEQIVTLLEQSARVLEPGGRFIAETVNPHALSAFKTFWVDPSHRQPLFPESLLVMSQAAGFSRGRILFPFGAGDARRDRWTEGEYALIASVGLVGP